MRQGVDVGSGLSSLPGAVKLGVQLFTPPDHSVEFSDECSAFLHACFFPSTASSWATSDFCWFRGLVVTFRCDKFGFLLPSSVLRPCSFCILKVMYACPVPLQLSVSSPSVAYSPWIACLVWVACFFQWFPVQFNNGGGWVVALRVKVHRCC